MRRRAIELGLVLALGWPAMGAEASSPDAVATGPELPPESPELPPESPALPPESPELPPESPETSASTPTARQPSPSAETEPVAEPPALQAPPLEFPTPSAPPAPRVDTLPPRPSFGQSPADLGLSRQDDGSYIYRDPGRRFTAVILPNGQVRFADRWRRPTAPTQPQVDRGRCCGAPPEGVARAANPFGGVPAPGLAEWAARQRGRQGSAEAKVHLLRRTEAFRVRLAVAAYRTELTASLDDLPAQLRALWESPLPLPQKRALLFARWDECEEALRPQSPLTAAAGSLDRMRARAAQQARRTIETFARTHARPGTPAAYSPRELRQLNQHRQSRAPFSPYRTAKSTP